MMGDTTGWGNWYDATNNINVGEMIADVTET